MEYLEKVNKGYRDYPYISERTNFIYPPHYHEEIEVVYMLSGRSELTLNAKEYTLSENDIFIIMPGEIHSFHSEKQNNMYIMKIYANADLSFYKVQGKISKDNPCYEAFSNILDLIVLENSERKNGYVYAVNMAANNLILQIIRTLSPTKISPIMQREAEKKLQVLERVNTYLDSHYAENIRLEQIARELNYSKYYFSHIFKEITNQSFVEFLTEFRLKKATKQLLMGNSVTQTALDCGFNNLRSFNRCFKNFYRVNPSEYKRINLS